ncbi:MAG TPA: hypothetical protein VH397_18310 [Xanthobacteraceae bacterium]
MPDPRGAIPLGPRFQGRLHPCDNMACDIAPGFPGATDRLAAIDPVAGLARVSWARNQRQGGLAMGLLLVFLVTLLIGQSISIGVGLLVEKHTTPYTGLVTFIVSYFLMFWLAWQIAVRFTRPTTRLGSWLSGK